jgi:hypothetical protein
MHQVRSSVLGEQVLGEQKFVGCNTDSPAIAQAGSDPSINTLETCPNADSAIGLLTLRTANFLSIANRTTLDRTDLAASRRLENGMQLFEMT